MEVICYACGKGEFPENTIIAIKNCQEVNSNWRIEMDIQLTSDNQIVLFHDEKLTRISGDKSKIKDLTLNKIKSINAAYNFKNNGSYPFRDNNIQIPTLEEVFVLFPEASFLLDIHTSNLNIINILIDLIEKYSMEDQIVIVSKHHKIKESIRQIKPSWIFGASKKDIKKLILSSMLKLDSLISVNSKVVMIPIYHGTHRLISSRVLNYIEKRNKKLWLWLNEGDKTITVNSKKEYQLCEFKGADGIFTMFPKKLSNEII